MSDVLVAETRVPTRDGCELVADVIRQVGAGPQPVLLIRTPYTRAGTRSNYDVVTLARDGWTVVIQDTRGRGHSPGDGTPFIHERADGYDTVTWCGAQPWSNGRVAMIGASYVAYTQWQAAADRPEALRAIAPIQGSPRIGDGWFHNGGTFAAGLAAMFGAGMAMTDPATEQSVLSRLTELCNDTMTMQLTRPSAHKLRSLYPPYESWLAPPEASLWSDSDAFAGSGVPDVPGYHVVGWYDLFCEAGLAAWRRMKNEAPSEYARASQRLIIGPWPHGVFGSVTPQLEFGPGSDIVTAAFSQMTGWLYEATEGKLVEAGVSAFFLGENRWRQLPDWPPASSPTELFLTTGPGGAPHSPNDGALRSGPGEPVVEGFTHRPEQPVPTAGGRTLGLWLPLPGPQDQTHIEARTDVLTYTSDVVREEVSIAGEVIARLQFTSDATSADLMVKLVDVHVDGRAFNIVEGAQRFRCMPGVTQTVNVHVGSVAQTFLPGHRIRVEVASSNAPLYDVNPSTDVGNDESAVSKVAHQSLHCGGADGSRIVLPVLGDTRFGDDTRWRGAHAMAPA